MKNRSRVLLLFTAIGLLSMGIIGCSIDGNTDQTEESNPIPVIVKQVELKYVEKEGRYIGTIVANKDVLVLPKMAGKVKEIFIKQGEMVKEGQVLLKIDDSDIKDSLRQAEASYQSALSNLTQAKEGKGTTTIQAEAQLTQAEDAFEQASKNLDRTKELFDAEAVPKTQLEQAETTYLQAENGLKIAQDAMEKTKSNSNIEALEATIEQAKVGVEQARRSLTDTKILAPFTGQVASIPVEVGEMASPQSPVAQVINLEQVLVKLKISELSLENFEKGKKVKVNIPSINELFDGEVIFIAPAADSQTLTFPVEILVNNKDQKIKSGMLTEVQLNKSNEQKQIVIPTKSVIGIGDNTYVFVLKGDKAEKRNIVVKEMGTEETIVASGLSETDKIIIKGQYGLENGESVEVIQEEGKTS